MMIVYIAIVVTIQILVGVVLTVMIAVTNDEEERTKLGSLAEMWVGKGILIWIAILLMLVLLSKDMQRNIHEIRLAVEAIQKSHKSIQTFAQTGESMVEKVGSIATGLESVKRLISTLK
jgi:Na+/melibiose symporter-like transporter